MKKFASLVSAEGNNLLPGGGFKPPGRLRATEAPKNLDERCHGRDQIGNVVDGWLIGVGLF